MRIRLSAEKKGVMGITGHVGCGHCHSHNQYIQDDSVGLAVVLALFQEATGLSLTIKEVRAVTGGKGSITVETVSGGIGVCSPRRGVTVQEARLAKTLEGQSAVRTQALTLDAFGRFYGQGVHETPVALQTAIANAALDSFVRNFPQQFVWAEEDLKGQCGLMAGTVLDFAGIPVAVLGTVNATQGGLGPVEDMEGNCVVGSKQKLMVALGIDRKPCLVVEGKVYASIYSDSITEPAFLVRADPEADNPVVGAALAKAVEGLGFAVSYRTDVMKRVPKSMENATIALGDAIIAGGERLKKARYSQEKVAALAELARLVSEDGAGVSFMSDRLHEYIGGTGIMPGTGAVISYVMPKAYRDEYVFPFLTEDDLARYLLAVKAGALSMVPALPEAQKHLEAHCSSRNMNELVLFRS